jgi:hypothetical protein
MSEQTVIAPKAFQEATIRAVMDAFSVADGTRRYLVADEPGLGKTVVARGVIQAMKASKRRDPLVVFYVCSSQSIASQNVQQLVSFLDNATRAGATAKADRPGLLPVFKAPVHPELHIYSITPGTAKSGRRGGLVRGKVQERALACALIEAILDADLPWLRDSLSWGADAFLEAAAGYRRRVAACIAGQDPRLKRVLDNFLKVIKEALGASQRRQLSPLLESLSSNRSELTRLCRNALAAASLAGLQPDLVIFDEFQRFRDLMREASIDPGNDSLAILDRKVTDALAGSLGQTKLLLLSATPYEALRAQDGKEVGHTRSDFFSVLDFLHEHLADAKARTDRVIQLFGAIETQLRHGTPMSEAAISARLQLTSMLRQVMCRTERPRVTHGRTVRREIVVEPLVEADVALFKLFARWLMKGDGHWSVPLWSSVPFPAQMLGAKYLCWKCASAARKRPVALTMQAIRLWRRPESWPNYKLRALFKVLPTMSLAMPWLRPSRPWWRLDGGWADAPGAAQADGKLLVFSRFAAVPGTVSALTSFNLECELRALRGANRGDAYKNWARPRYSHPDRSVAVFSLFYVSTLLAQLDPLVEGAPGTQEMAATTLGTALRQRLRSQKVNVVRKASRKDMPLHVLLIALAVHFGHWEEERKAWVAALCRSVEGATPASIGKVLSRWLALTPTKLTEVSTAEVRELVSLSLDSPAIATARALQRHWPEALSGERRGMVQALVCGPLRKYLDRPWFATALRETQRRDFATVLRQAVREGNLEAVMDEHFWLLSQTSNSSWPERLATLGQSLGLTGGRTVLHGRDSASHGRVRCHVALPLHQPKSTDSNEESDAIVRPDQVRQAFNTPFWPNVLVTTSVGQEGLDFHPWCRSIAHWDPARGPVDLEQREGRVDRYAGLSIRRALAMTPECLDERSSASPWTSIAALAKNLASPNGMAPWWQAPGAQTVQFYLMTNGSREQAHLHKLERSRALYRMLIGVSDPEPLLEELETSSTVDETTALAATLRLGAWELDTE